tara:strand:+ start:449 stop:625 length:177 start_codon:yes stop_codon:yes gene_type:complete
MITKITIQTKIENIVVVKNFFLISGFSGAPGSFPFFTFFGLLIFSGKNKNRETHQITK